jgi:pyruvate dehydrogenase E1 component
MPDFWQFPTGSMGLGPLQAIYQARFMRYLQHRGLLADRACARSGASSATARWTSPSRSPRSRWRRASGSTTWSSSSTATCSAWTARCAATASIVEELEALFAGAGWNVIKVLWGSDWDALFARDPRHALLRAFAQTVDGQFQTLRRQRRRLQPRALLPARRPNCRRWWPTWRRRDRRLRRGGHDPVKIHAAFAAAGAHGPADRDPGQDHEGLRHGRRRPGPHDHAPAEEARAPTS